MGKADNGTYGTLLLQWQHNVREQRRDVRLPNLALVAGHLEPHADLHVPKLPRKLALL